MSMCLRRHHLRGPGNAETPSLASPLTGEGTDTTLCPKKAVITGWMGDCYISTRLPIGQGGPADARFQTSTSRIELQQNYQGETQSETQTHFNIRRRRKQEKKQRLLTFFGVCGVARRLQTIKRELWSDWNKIPVMTNNAAVDSGKLQSCRKLLQVTFKPWDLTAALKPLGSQIH